MMLGMDGFNISLVVVAGLVVLPGVSFALAGSNHCHFVGSAGAICALQLYALGPRFVVDATPFLGAPAAPVFETVATSNPVG